MSASSAAGARRYADRRPRFSLSPKPPALVIPSEAESPSERSKGVQRDLRAAMADA